MTLRLAPDVGLADGERRLSDFRGQTVVVVLQPEGRNPADAELLSRYNALLAPLRGPERLDHVRHEGAWYDLDLTGGSLRLPLLASADLAPDAARRFGVVGRHAVFVVTEDGRIGWSCVAPAGLPVRPEELQEALVALDRRVVDTPLSRRHFVAAALGVAALAAVASHEAAAKGLMAGGGTVRSLAASGGTVKLTVNGQIHSVQIEPRVTLLDALRERIGLTGTKMGCNHGQCGACTVLVDGSRVNACLTLAVMAAGKRITTIEGLATGSELHPLQAAFIKHDGFQCGYCTPGQIMAATGLLSEPVGPTDDDVREAMSGNLCRCGAYRNIVAAIQEVRKGGGHAPV